MNLKYAYETGFVTGYNIAVQNRGDYNLADEDERERFISEMCEHESDVYRQFSPFEFTAKEFNASRNPDKTQLQFTNFNVILKHRSNTHGNINYDFCLIIGNSGKWHFRTCWNNNIFGDNMLN